MDKFDLLNDLEQNCEYSAAELKNMDTKELVDARLRYEGFIGYTDDIISWVAPYFQENPASSDYSTKLEEAIWSLRYQGKSSKEILEEVNHLLKSIN